MEGPFGCSFIAVATTLQILEIMSDCVVELTQLVLK